MHYVADIIPTLKWRGGRLGVRLALFPKDIEKLFAEYREAYFAARITEKANTKNSDTFNLFPKDLCEFLGKKLNMYFSIKAYIPERSPSPEDLNILKVTEGARKAFDETLALKFAPAIKELEELGYPGVTDPKLTIEAKVTTSETLKHESAVQYSLSKSDETLKLPEKYNGLGYQNLISMVFDLMEFRDTWMREGKVDNTDTAREPLHLVLIEEPEAHLHMQVQQVFIRQAYKVLTNHDFLKKYPDFATQLIISTHSSHIARESDFANLRYFKRTITLPTLTGRPRKCSFSW
ncbi:MAG: ATP-binding protein [Oscillospiraceae bacterium]|nr:ATP-binding protein [Oscillospiraceae bacterium]